MNGCKTDVPFGVMTRAREPKMNWARGFFRAWLVAATLWVGLFGWSAFTNNTWSGWRSYPVADDCLDRYAKWPDGKPWDEWDRAGLIDYNLTLSESELSLEDLQKKRSHDVAWAKIGACSATKEDAKPIMQRVSYLISNDWSGLKGSIAIILLPPLALLIAGCVFNWIIKGFRANA